MCYSATQKWVAFIMEKAWTMSEHKTQKVSPVTRHSSVGRHSFVFRIWPEEGHAGWRGWVEHTRTGEATFVQELDELLAFIECRPGKLGP